MVKTYLSLPERVTGINLSRKEMVERTQNFPSMIKTLEVEASEKVNGVDLGEIEYFHNLRNELYHQGNGLTVEKGKVQIFAEWAKILFRNLFGYDIAVEESRDSEILGEFMSNWAKLEQGISILIGRKIENTAQVNQVDSNLPSGEKIGEDFVELRQIRNEVTHGVIDYRTALTPDVFRKLNELTKRVDLLIERQLRSKTEDLQFDSVPLEEEKNIAASSIPRELRELVGKNKKDRKNMSNWNLLLLILHFLPNGLTNKEIRNLSRKLGKPISYSWFDTEFHRKRHEGLVVSKRDAGSKQVKYFLADPGERRAIEVISFLQLNLK